MTDEIMTLRTLLENDPVMMFKILVIQATNNVSDERAEFLINDRSGTRSASPNPRNRMNDSRKAFVPPLYGVPAVLTNWWPPGMRPWHASDILHPETSQAHGRRNLFDLE
jgi:hypothetical protein